MCMCVLIVVCVKLQHTNVIDYLMLLQGRSFYCFFLTQSICVFHCYMYSDGTLNPSGVRFGTAELYDIREC